MKRLLSCVLVVGCSVGVRAQGSFETEVALPGVRAVTLNLPATPLAVQGCDRAVPESCPDALQVRGRWHAVGGTRAQARDNARAPSLEFERYEDLLSVRASVPLSVQGLVDLEVDGLRLPADLDLELRTGLGDVSALGMSGSLLIDTEVGDVEIRGAMRSTGVHVGEGQVLVVGPGAVDVDVEAGGVHIEQTAGAADATVYAPGGDVALWLGGDANVDLEIHAPGRIAVQTDALSASTSGSYRVRTGTGAAEVSIIAGGDVWVRLRATP